MLTKLRAFLWVASQLRKGRPNDASLAWDVIVLFFPRERSAEMNEARNRAV